MNLITTSDRFAIFGARGMAGSAISRALDRSGYKQQLKPIRQELDLLDPAAVQALTSLLQLFVRAARGRHQNWDNTQLWCHL